MRPGAPEEDIAQLDRDIGLALPSEFKELYRAHNGVGVVHESEPGKPIWTFVPTSDLASLMKGARSWFEEFHPDLASRFFPFIDWDCGDYTGYVVSPGGGLLEGLFTFSHELYQFRPDQAPETFLSRNYSCIKDFLATD